MRVSRRKIAITLVLMGSWLIFCAFQLLMQSNYLISNELYFEFEFQISKLTKSQFWYDDQGVTSRTSDCEKYFKQFVPVLGVDKEYLFQENVSSTPLAFSHLVHTQSAILEVNQNLSGEVYA